MLTKEKELDMLKKRMNLYCQCPLKKGAKNIVFGEGNASSTIMFIGEAPGKKEDESAKPFVGMAGKILSSLLKKSP